MAWQISPFTPPLAVAAAIALGLAAYAWPRRAAPGAAPFILLMTALAVFASFYALELAAVDLPLKLLCAQIEYAGITRARFAKVTLMRYGNLGAGVGGFSSTKPTEESVGAATSKEEILAGFSKIEKTMPGASTAVSPAKKAVRVP